jgi:hypothetical protein
MRRITVYEGGAWAYFYAEGRRVAWVHWSPEGRVNWERTFDAKGRKHGVERYRHDDGRVSYEVRWKHGLRHGKAQQWDERGRLVLETTFRDGTGTDVWWCGGILAEVRAYRSGKLHGIEQWWATKKTVFVEGSWFEGRKHGVWRMWGDAGNLEGGGPHFYVRGKRVSRAEYLATRERDPSLGPYRAEDDAPTRVMGAEASRTQRARPPEARRLAKRAKKAAATRAKARTRRTARPRRRR